MEKNTLFNVEIFKNRRVKLRDALRQAYPTVTDGVVLMLGGLEGERLGFRQDSSFYYFTGITEPAAAWLMHLDGTDILYLPNFGKEREKWVNVGVSLESNPEEQGFTKILALSDVAPGYSYGSRFNPANYKKLLHDLSVQVRRNATFFGELTTHTDALDQAAFFNEVRGAFPGIDVLVQDASAIMHEMRRHKDTSEMSALQRAIDITVDAQKKAASVIKPGIPEYEVQAWIEYVFRQQAGAQPSFPTIVAAGKNSTTLHYVDRNAIIEEGDLVVIDIGAEYNYYAADITRTYPASGSFSSRQREVYQMVLDAQTYIASIAKPGMYLRNKDKKEASLHWHAVRFFQERGYADYFPHGIGHYLGLDVHDVGDYAVPLKAGDVFTIEPGLYLSHEALGIRIEDDYLMTPEGAICLSNGLPKTVEAIEFMMR